ncbi:hypothetical protein BDW42DRAFT_174653 [Aspergillus taichungensis]|uniref:Uncharacterized protein n=1 Tax=Aspergillus taichungensis TaxID=482145 RepID=A0A2J5HN04_9EURO|nr:hypothetical protein BDW42DRAFT_174653 [Aspergillus taichungensis]
MYRLTMETKGRVGEPWAQPLTVARASSGASYSIILFFFSSDLCVVCCLLMFRIVNEYSEL